MRSEAERKQTVAFQYATMREMPTFISKCPNGHDVNQTFSVEQLRNELKTDSLRFHCIFCDTWWKPSSVEKANILRQFDDAR